MWPFSKKPKPVDSPSGLDKTVELLTEQCCAWLEAPIQKPPRVVVFETTGKAKAVYNSLTDVVAVYGKDNVTDAILAHEIAHAVVLRHIAQHTLLTPKMHEILAGYAEFQVMKIFNK